MTILQLLLKVLRALEADDSKLTPSEVRSSAIAAVHTYLEAQEHRVKDLRDAIWLDPECAESGMCQSLRFDERRESAIAAITTLERMGYTYGGGELWKPPSREITP